MWTMGDNSFKPLHWSSRTTGDPVSKHNKSTKRSHKQSLLPTSGGSCHRFEDYIDEIQKIRLDIQDQYHRRADFSNSFFPTQ